MVFQVKIFFFVALLLLAITAFFVLDSDFLSESFVIFNTPKDLVKKEPQQIRFLAVGDIMLDRGVEYMVNKYGEGDFKFPFLKIASLLSQADLVFGNLESVISDKGYNVGSAYSFRANPKAIDGLKFAGFDIVNLAHNHAFDYTTLALQDTMALLATSGIDFVGAGASDKRAFGIVVKETKETKIGFLGFANVGPRAWRAQNNTTGIAWVEKADFLFLSEAVKQVKAQVDILVVSLHAGVEYSKTPDAFQQEFAKLCIDSGADLILGHHPHVIQPLEKYNNGWVAYSLGNFIFDQAFSKETMQGGLLEVFIENKKIKTVQLKQVKLNNFYQPQLID